MPLSVVARYRDPHEAHLARALLEASGIQAFVADEHAVGVNWLLSQSIGGVRVQVDAESLEDARAVLAASAETQGDAEATAGDAADGAERCPNCGVAGESMARKDRRVRALSMLIGIPFALGRDKLECPGCGVRWRSRDASERSPS